MNAMIVNILCIQPTRNLHYALNVWRKENGDTWLTNSKKRRGVEGMVLKNCVICGDEFEAKVHNAKVCGDACRKEQKRRLDAKRRAQPKPKIFKRCVICGDEFEAKGNGKTCSPICSTQNDVECRARRYQNNKEIIAQQNRQYYQDNKDTIVHQKIRYRRDNKEGIAQYYQDNKDSIARKMAQYYQNNREAVLKRKAQYMKTDEGRASAKRNWNKRRKNAQSVINNLTLQQERFMLFYFNNACVICDASHEHKDHWVPISKGGGYTVTNVVPMCASCNCSKNATMPGVWLRRKFSEHKARKIEKRIQEYFDSVREQNTNPA
jgi:hypothetical protein